MFEAASTEFPFMAEMPKREKSRLAKAWDLVKALSAAQDREGNLLPVMLAAQALDLSRTRIQQLEADGRLKIVRLDAGGGHPYVFVTEDSLIEFAKTERKNGRPLNLPESLTECAKRAKKPY